MLYGRFSRISTGAYTDTRQAPAQGVIAKNKLFCIYRDGIQVWPVGIICGRRIRGFGFGVWKSRGSDFCIGIGAIFSFHIIHINWKALRKGAGA
jgi:hypothetical protein